LNPSQVSSETTFSTKSAQTKSDDVFKYIQFKNKLNLNPISFQKHMTTKQRSKTAPNGGEKMVRRGPLRTTTTFV
jgi:hypothetical protein